jgi:chemotaxis protein methyltransferase CheR
MNPGDDRFVDEPTMRPDSEFHVRPMEPFSPELRPKHFRAVQRLAYRVAGIDLHPGKEDLVRARLMKRLRVLHLPGFDQYFKYLERDRSGREAAQMIDVLTTNKTFFFREAEHFECLKKNILPALRGKKLQLWCAGCSSGEEPYSLVMTLLDAFPDMAARDIRVLATDISQRMLDKARAAVYGKEQVESLPLPFITRFFDSVPDGRSRIYRIRPEVRSLIHFARLNLMDEWPMSGKFDVIFCRNVMIYFDRPVQRDLIRRFHSILKPDGHLIVGLSESLASVAMTFRYVQPAVYRRIPERTDR